jgi:hypothetical protein
MKNNNSKNSFGQFAGKQLNSKQTAQIKGGNGDGSAPGGDPDPGVVVVDVIIV